MFVRHSSAIFSAFLAVLFPVLPKCSSCSERTKCPSSAKGYTYDQPGARITGKLLQRTVFGPPGYGESPTNPKVKIMILKLSCPIDLHAESASVAPNTSNVSTFHAIKEIQLFLSDNDQRSFARRHLEMNVAVVGRFEEGVAGGEYTKVTMDVEQISSLNPNRKQLRTR